MGKISNLFDTIPERFKPLFSSMRKDWETPPDLFMALDQEFHFELDACASAENKKCPLFYFGENGLELSWAPCRTWINPPYGRRITGLWVRKAHEESLLGALVVALLPARTDTAWFHDYILGKAEIRFIRGRLKFVGAKSGAPFPSMIVIWRHSGGLRLEEDGMR